MDRRGEQGSLIVSFLHRRASVLLLPVCPRLQPSLPKPGVHRKPLRKDPGTGGAERRSRDVFARFYLGIGSASQPNAGYCRVRCHRCKSLQSSRSLGYRGTVATICPKPSSYGKQLLKAQCLRWLSRAPMPSPRSAPPSVSARTRSQKACCWPAFGHRRAEVRKKSCDSPGRRPDEICGRPAPRAARTPARCRGRPSPRSRPADPRKA